MSAFFASPLPFPSFLPAEAFLELRDVYIGEVMEDMDKNKDGFVTVEEYVGEWCACYASLCGSKLRPYARAPILHT